MASLDGGAFSQSKTWTSQEALPGRSLSAEFGKARETRLRRNQSRYFNESWADRRRILVLSGSGGNWWMRQIKGRQKAHGVNASIEESPGLKPFLVECFSPA